MNEPLAPEFSIAFKIVLFGAGKMAQWVQWLVSSLSSVCLQNPCAKSDLHVHCVVYVLMNLAINTLTVVSVVDLHFIL